MEELRRLSDDVDRKTQAVAEREQVVEAVRRGVEGIHALGLKSQAELAAIAERRAEIAQAKGELDRLRDSLAGTQEKIVAIESRRQLVDDGPAQSRHDHAHPGRRADHARQRQ